MGYGRRVKASCQYPDLLRLHRTLAVELQALPV
jgi:hypothetical protein